MSRPPTTGFAAFSLENLALGLLMAGPKHGYRLYQDYERYFLPIWKVGRSDFYAALASLHAAGYLDVQVEPQSDRPPRKIYHLTETGQARFDEWLYRPVTPARAIRVEMLAKLRFIALLRFPDAGRIFDAQIEACREIINELDQVEAAGAHDDPVLELVHDFRRRQALFIIDWLRACRERLGQSIFHPA
jgi:DNA-binding PadR family transcriptional regulator